MYADENKILKGILFQTQEMRSSFPAYPELVLHKLNDLRMPLYVLQILDGNGQAEIICFWLVASEDRSTISYMMDAFKKRNDCWPKVQVIIADKDMMERHVLCKKLPNADILICLFHTYSSKFQTRNFDGKNGHFICGTHHEPRIATENSIFKKWRRIYCALWSFQECCGHEV